MCSHFTEGCLILGKQDRERVKWGRKEGKPRPGGGSPSWPQLLKRTQCSQPVPQIPYGTAMNKNSPSRAIVPTLYLLAHSPLLSLTGQSSPDGLLPSCTFGLWYKALPGSYWESQSSVGLDPGLALPTAIAMQFTVSSLTFVPRGPKTTNTLER